jgi:hypothetical protein
MEYQTFNMFNPDSFKNQDLELDLHSPNNNDLINTVLIVLVFAGIGAYIYYLYMKRLIERDASKN